MALTIESPALVTAMPVDVASRETAPTAPYLRVHCVTVFVRDQDRSRDFYLNTLGFSLVVDTLHEQFRWLAVAARWSHSDRPAGPRRL